MIKKQRSLWELLLLLSGKKSIELSCGECLTLLDFDAERIIEGASISDIQDSIQQHLSYCSSCRTKFQNGIIEQVKRFGKESED